MRRLLLLASLSALPLFACGSNPQIDPLTVNLEGSYELTLGTVTRAAQGPGPIAPQVTDPSAGKVFRLDLRRNGSSYDAVVTPQWGTPAAMAVSLKDGAIVLRGETNVGTSTTYGGVFDRWLSIVVPVGEGGLGALVTLSGDEMVSEGDVGWMYTIQSAATVIRDKNAPDLRLVGTGSAAGKYLPWDKLRVVASEPIELGKFQGGVRASVKTTNAVFTARPDPNASATAWAGLVALDGTFDNFDVPGGKGLLTIDRGIPDRAGNISAPAIDPTQTAFEMADLGAPQAALDFDGKDAFAPAVWGGAGVVQGPECEGGGGCAKLGTFQQTYCESSSDGLAARLTSTGAKTLAFRYRVHVESKYGGGTSGTYDGTHVMSVQLARAGSALNEASVTMPKLQNVGTTEKPIFESAWVDASVPLPAGGASLGFAIRPTSLFPYGCGGPAPAPTDVTVWIDGLHAE